MVTFLIFVACGIFVFGLMEWAMSGSSIWRIFSIRRRLRNEGGDMGWREKEAAEKEAKRLEGAADRLLSASFKAVAWLTFFIWIAVGLTFLFDAIGVNWATRITARASVYWRSGIDGFGKKGDSTRGELLRNMGGGLK